METNYSFDSSDSSISYINVPAAAATTTSSSIQNSLSRQPPSSFHRSLHSVRKSAHQNKPWSSGGGSKKATASLPPNPTRVYKVDRMKFRELVQMLTGAAEVSAANRPSQPRRLREVAPPPLDLTTSAPQASTVLPEKAASTTASTPLSALYRELMSETLPDAKTSHHELSDGILGTSGSVSLGLGLSPSSLGWSSVPLLSPGTFI